MDHPEWINGWVDGEQSRTAIRNEVNVLPVALGIAPWTRGWQSSTVPLDFTTPLYKGRSKFNWQRELVLSATIITHLVTKSRNTFYNTAQILARAKGKTV